MINRLLVLLLKATARENAPWDPSAPFSDNVSRGRGFGVLWEFDHENGFRFKFDFSTHRDWDPRVSALAFNTLVNDAANRARSGPTINGKKFISALEQLLQERPDQVLVGNMVKRFLWWNGKFNS